MPHTFDVAQATKFTVEAGKTVRVDDRAISLAGISGHLTDAAGAPASGLRVTVNNVDTLADVQTTTLADGSYDFTNQLVPGQYKVEFTTTGHSQYAHQQLDYNSANVITVSSGATSIVDDQLLWTATAK